LIEAYSYSYLDNIGNILKEILTDKDILTIKEEKI